MIDFKWSILEIFGDQTIAKVRYLLKAQDEQNTVESEGNHTFSEGVANKPLSEIVESDIIQWLEKDTTQNDVNLIKLAIENQLKAIENAKKVDFPWLANTFTVE